MAYTRTTWADEVPAASPVKYSITDDIGGIIASSAVIELVTSVTPGTPVAAAALNNIEEGILTLESDLATQTARIDNAPPYALDAKGDIYVATGDGVGTRLAVGANGMTLQADSTQAAGIKWANGYPGQITAKGDLLVGTAADTGQRVPVGSNYQVLMADSAQTTGVKWADSVPGMFTAKGQIAVATAADTAANLGVGATGTYLIPDAAEATGLKWVPMINVGHWTNASWDGDNKVGSTTYTFLMSTIFSGVPNAAKMVLVRLEAEWAAITSNSWMWITTDSTPGSSSPRLLSLRGQAVNIPNTVTGWVPLTSAGRFYLQTENVSPNNVSLSIEGYML